MRMTKKLLSMILAVVMVLGLLPATVFATETSKLTLVELREQYGAITVEAYTIGQGFLVEPSLYEKEAGLTTAVITMELLESKNIDYRGDASYISGFAFDDTVAAEYPEYITDPSQYGLEEYADGDGYLCEFDYGWMSGWVHTIDYWFASWGIDVTGPGVELEDYNTGETTVLGDVIRWHFSAAGYGADCGIPGNAMAESLGGNLFTQEDKTDLIFNLAAINDYYGNSAEDDVYETALAVAANPLASATEIATQEAALAAYIEEIFFAEEESDKNDEAQDVSGILNATMAQLATTVTTPSFGTSAGEWTVFSLARGNYYAKDNAYFNNYYTRIVETVNNLAASVNMNGALDKNKSTENSRLIFALSAIGKNATAVGDWNLIVPYENFDWIKKQGINGVIFALLALDSNNYATSDTTIRQQCVDYLLDAQHDDGGWSMMPTSTLESNVDVTAMTLQALYPYRNQANVATACEEAITWLSDVQTDNGGFLYGSDGETAESCAQVIVALTTWDINPDTDSHFIKNGNSAVDNLLSYYIEDEAMFAHQGSTSSDMATDQATYALVAYDRFINGKKALYDYSDVTFEEDTVVTGKPTATLGLPAQITDDVGKTFNAVITLDQWDNTAGYKLIDFILNVPEGLSVTGVTAGSRLTGGEVSYHLDEDGKLRVVYFDANEHSDLTVISNTEGNSFPAQFFTVTFQVDAANVGEKKNIAISGMSVKLTSDSSDENAMVKVDTTTAAGNIEVVKGISYSAICLYTGDDIDLIPATKMAVAVSVVGIENATKLTYNDGTNQYVFKYSEEISNKTGIATYVALVDASIAMEQFVNKLNFTFTEDAATNIKFGDTNGDGVVNAQDALNAVDAWLRKGDAPTDDQILTLNVNGDTRINTFDALGIVEKFIDGSDFGVVTKAATITTNQ